MEKVTYELELDDYTTVIKDGMRFLDFDKIINLCPDALYYICVGSNSAGKSYYIKKTAILNAVNGFQTMVVRRLGVEVKRSVLATYFDDIVDFAKEQFSKIYPDYDVFDIKPYQGWFNLYGINGKKRDLLMPILKYNSLSTWANDKSSTVLPTLKNIFFEEFIPSANSATIPDEFGAFRSLINTVVRGLKCDVKNVKIWLFGNTMPNYRNNIILRGMNLNPAEIGKGLSIFDSYIYNTDGNRLHVKTCVLRYGDGIGRTKEQQALTAFDNQSIQMSINGEMETAEYKKLSKIELNNISENAYILKVGDIALYVYDMFDKIFISHKRIKSNKIHYVVIYDGFTYIERNWYNINSRIPQIDNILMKIGKVYNLGLVYFDTDLTGEDFNNNFKTYCN